MKKTLLIAMALAVTLSASSLAAANTNWQGKYSSGDQGIWKGTIYDNPAGLKPYFEGKWASVDVARSGKLYATLVHKEAGIYNIVKGIIYDEKGNEIGWWNGYFDLTVKPGAAQGTWAWTGSPFVGSWKGQRVFADEE